MKTLITGALKCSEEQIQKLGQLGLEIQFLQDETKKIDANKLNDIEFIVCNSFFLYNDIRQFKELKYIQVTSAGLDRLPLEYIKEKNIKVFNAKGVYSIPMAEWTILKILEIYKHSKEFYKNQEEHIWKKDRNILELDGKTATILGYGNVGSEIAKKLKAFGVKIQAVGKKEKCDKDCYIDKYYESKQMIESIKNADIVITTLPLNEETEGLIDKKYFENMKNKSIFINISRGQIINENDLIEFIKRNKFMGVILDVFENEPLNKESLLWDMDNVIITPHNSFVSEKNGERIFELILDNINTIINNR